MKTLALKVFVIIFFASLAACTPKTDVPQNILPFENWKYSDVKLLADPESTNYPATPIAFYYRKNNLTDQIRLDFIRLPGDADLYITLKTLPVPDIDPETEQPFSFLGSATWNQILVIKAGQPPQAYDTEGKIVPGLIHNITLDAALASLVIDIDSRLVPAELSSAALQVFITRPGSTRVLSHSPLARLNAAPSARAPMLLAFWDTLPAATPAQVLRRWDGAHTGPLGLRHGLTHLVENAAAYHIPVFLLDLKTPQSLSALDYLGHLSRLRMLVDKNILILPDPAYGDPASSPISIGFSRQAGQRFGFSKSEIAFSPVATEYNTAFAVLSDHYHLQEWYGQRYIPLPGTVYPTSSSASASDNEVDEHGLSENTKLNLLKTALSPDTSDLVVLGGSLLSSPWGDTSVAPITFRQLAAYPWIQLLDDESLSGLKTIPLTSLPAGCQDLLCSPKANQVLPYNSQGKQFSGAANSDQIKTIIRLELEKMPESQLKDTAWEEYLRLTEPTSDAQREALLTNYLPQLGLWMSVMSWAVNPKSSLDCTRDLDWDGLPECILANEKTFLVLKPDGGRLVLAVTYTQSGFTQWIGPASQFAVGLSDPLDWQINLGPGSDPGEIPGAFTDQKEPYQIKQVDTGQNEITFTNPVSLEKKKFSLTERGLDVQISSSSPANLRIPITMLDLERYRPDWYQHFRIQQDKSSFILNKRDGHSLNVTISGGSFTTTPFYDSFEWMRQPEDPNRTYPPGHYLPFPLIMVNLNARLNCILSFKFE